MSAGRGFGRECEHFHAKLSDKLTEKRNKRNSVVAAWVRQNIMFSLVNSIINPVNIYSFRVSNRNTRKRCEICSKLTTKTPERRQ